LKSKIKYILLASILLLPGFLTPRTQAIEPITMVLLAPVALKVYEAAEPRLVRGAKYGGRKLVQMGSNIIEFFYLPLGVIQTTLGAPFGYFSNGVRNIGKGALAPCKLIINTLAFPFTLFGVDL